jgi:hypothetical protein
MGGVNSTEQLREHVLRYFLNYKRVVSSEVLEGFVKSVRFHEGHIAHMHYGPLIDATSESETIKFLSTIGISEEIFTGIRDTSCEGDMAARSCIRAPGYVCDPRYCQSH